MYSRKKRAYNQVISKVILCFVCLLFSSNMLSQTEFFNSKISFSSDHLDTFYSSFSVDSTQVYFNANDYYVHAFNKKSGKLNWSYYSSNKSNKAPKLNQNSVFITKHISEYDNKCVQLNAKTGDTIQTLKIEALNTQPFFRDNLMFCTAICPGVGGAVMAYDLKKNAVVWQKFIAHGVSAQPYYLKDKIIANAEGDNWFELDYNGKLLDTTCKNKTDLFVEDIKCVRKFRYLTHNQKELSGSYFDEEEFPKLAYAKNKTIILAANKMLVINNKNKIEKEIKLEEILKIDEGQESNYTTILKAEENTVWFFTHNILTVYDFKSGKTIKTYDLTQWNVHQAILENDNLWLISRKDGQLVGVNLDK